MFRHCPNIFVPQRPSMALLLRSSVPLALPHPSLAQDSCACDCISPYSKMFSRSQHASLVPFRGPLTSFTLIFPKTTDLIGRRILAMVCLNQELVLVLEKGTFGKRYSGSTCKLLFVPLQALLALLINLTCFTMGQHLVQ